MAMVGKETWYRQLKPGDLFVYIIVVTVSLLMLFSAPGKLFDGSADHANQPLRATVSVDGSVLHEMDQDTLLAGGNFEFESYGYHYIVSYMDGRVRIDEADCPDQVCVLTGWLGRNGQITACVPGHVLLKIEGNLLMDSDQEQPGDSATDPDIILR